MSDTPLLDEAERLVRTAGVPNQFHDTGWGWYSTPVSREHARKRAAFLLDRGLLEREIDPTTLEVRLTGGTT